MLTKTLSIGSYKKSKTPECLPFIRRKNMGNYTTAITTTMTSAILTGAATATTKGETKDKKAYKASPEQIFNSFQWTHKTK